MLKIGLVGLGGMGTVHLHNYDHIAGGKVVAICDISQSAKEIANQRELLYYSNMNDMLAKCDIDVVDICTPTFLHADAVMTALRHDKHVICEKPLSLHIKEVEGMYALAHEKGVQLLVAHVLQYAPSSNVLRKLVHDKTYGELLDIHMARLSACPRWIRGGWLFDKEKSGHIPFDLHIHDLDLLVSLLGNPAEYSCTKTGRESVDYAEHYRFSYKFAKATASVEAAWYHADIPFTATWRAYFDEAVVICDEKGVIAYPYNAEPIHFDISEKICIPTGINLPATGMFYEELTDFLSIIKNSDGINIHREMDIRNVIATLEALI